MFRSRKLSIVVAAALIGPAMIFVALNVAFQARSQRQALENATLSRAENIIHRTDREVARSVASLRALATAQALERGDWPEAAARAEELISLNPDWRQVYYVDGATGEVRFSAGPAAEWGDHAMGWDVFPPPGSVVVGGVVRHENGAGSILMTAGVGTSAAAGRLVALVDPAPLQTILVNGTPAEAVSAIVDREGRFIARNLAVQERLGRPATEWVRGAIASGRRGIYEGTTYEGLRNHTGFVTSDLTGWSTHIAVSNALLAAPQRRWWLGTLGAGALAIAFAASAAFAGAQMAAAERRAQERLRVSERMEALGKLAGGVAHDFNNMLSIVLASIDLAQRRMGRGADELAPLLEAARDGARRASELTRRMLAFSRRQSLDPVVLDPNRMIIDMGDILRRTIGSHVLLRFDLAEGLGNIEVDRVQLENAIVNLVANARDAMPQGGHLTISTFRAEAGTGLLGPGAIIRVADTGCGMKPDVAARALEPFFTTKDVGRGTGLGLSQVYGFVTQSGGDVAIRTAPGEGTTVDLILPLSARPESAGGAEPAPAAAARGSCERILVVEDEPRVAALITDALRELGYEVHMTNDPEAALEMLKGERPLDLLVSDIVMPEMNGREFVRRARALRPGLKVLFVSAYEPDAIEGDGAPLLRKPFTIDALAASVRSVLTG